MKPILWHGALWTAVGVAGSVACSAAGGPRGDGTPAQSDNSEVTRTAAASTLATDPGPRGGAAAAGGAFPTLNAAEQVEFATALDTFNGDRLGLGDGSRRDRLGPRADVQRQ